MKLSAIEVRNAKSKGKAYKLADGKGLYLHISPTGKKTWRYRYRFDGKETTIVFGEYPLLSLEKARKKRIAARNMLDNGQNPSVEKQRKKQQYIAKLEEEQRRQQNSFKTVAAEWMEKQRESWSDGHARSVRRSLEQNVFPFIGKLSMEDITPKILVDMMGRMEKRNALEAARKTLQRVNAIFMYGIRTERVIINPAASLKGALKTRKVEHHKALHKDEMPKFLKDLEAEKLHISTKLGMRFLILSGARSKNLRTAEWCEIKLDDKMWRIDGGKMKTGQPHNIPLSTQAIQIIEQMGDMFGRSGYIFPSIRDYAKPMSVNALSQAIKRMGYQGKTTVHGFRTTFSSTANEAGFDADVIEKALAHEERNKVRAAYHRAEYIEQRRELMQWWGDLLENLEHGAKIIPIFSAAQ